MINPYQCMYESTMDIYRYTNGTDAGGFDTEEESLVATGVSCRYSISGQSTTGSPVPSVAASNQLFCGLDVDIKEGDKVLVTMRDGQTIRLQVGEVHPFRYQYQCRVERDEKA